MNQKYFPKLRKYAEYAESISNNPDVIQANKIANKPSDMLIAVHHALMDNGIDCKNTALEVAKMIFYGYYQEINAYYQC